MKTHYFRKFGIAAVILATALPVSFSALATRAAAQAETTASGTAAQITIAPTATYYWVSGNKAKFQEDMGQRAGASAGIQSFTYGKQIDDKTRVDFEGRAIFGNEDYLLHFTIQKDDWFKVDFGYKQFFTPYDADGLYFNYNGNSAFGSDKANVTNQMGVTRSDFWIDIKTLFPNVPTFTLHYDRSSRYGDAGSTIMGGYTIAGVTGARGILPAYTNINEVTDTISLDVDQQLKTFSYGAGVWGQHTTTQNATYSVSGANTVGAGNTTTTDAVGAHAYVTGDINKQLSYGAGALYNQFEYDINYGGRYTYVGTEQIYDPTDRAYTGNPTNSNILDETTYKEWAASANLNWRPTKNWFIVPSINFEDYRTDVMADYNTAAPGSGAAPTSLTNSGNNWFQSTEKLEIRFVGLQNWTHTLSAEFNQGTGSNDYATGGAAYIAGTGTATAYSTTNQTSYTTKVAYTANWYATSALSFTGQYYYKNNRNNYDTPSATHTGRYPGLMSSQGFETNDFNIRMTWRPFTWASNVFRYDYQRSTINTAYGQTFDNQTPAGGYLTNTDSNQTGKTQTHIISESLTLTPHPRLNINLNGSVVFDQTALPPNVYIASNMGAAAGYSSANQTVVNADNNFLNAGFSILYAATDLDDVSLDYNYYKTWNYVNNSRASVPYGANEHQYIISLGWTRRFNANLQFNLGYTYIGYKNYAQGGNLDYHANGITGTLRYKF